MDDYNNKLDSLFIIPWETFPLSNPTNPRRQSPGYENTNHQHISEYLYKNLEKHYQELGAVSNGYKMVIHSMIQRAVVLANYNRGGNKSFPSKISPNFIQFAIPLQTDFFLGDHKLTPEDREFFFRVQREMEHHPAYHAYKESLENKKTKQSPQ